MKLKKFIASILAICMTLSTMSFPVYAEEAPADTSVVATVATGHMWLLYLVAALLMLLVPYVRHYYILENEVQKMYAQYDIIIKKGHNYENNSTN